MGVAVLAASSLHLVEEREATAVVVAKQFNDSLLVGNIECDENTLHVLYLFVHGGGMVPPP
jgi:hypothetical protein